MDDTKAIIDSRSPRFLDKVQIHMRKNGLAYKTDQRHRIKDLARSNINTTQ